MQFTGIPVLLEYFVHMQLINRCCVDAWRRGARVHFFIHVAFYIIAASAIWPSSVLADGSKTLLAQHGHRPFLEGGFGRDVAGIDRLNRFYVFAKAGEVIHLGSSALGIGEGDILFTNPDGVQGSCLSEAPQDMGSERGRIFSLEQELAGPDPGKGGYRSCELPVTEENEGLWEVVFLAPSPESWKFSASVPARASWIQAPDVYTIAAWDIAVQDSRRVERTGRVFAEHIPLNMGSATASLHTNVYVLTQDGYLYRATFSGIQAHTFSIFANKNGFQSSDGGHPLHRSIVLDQLNTANKGLPEGITIDGPENALDDRGTIYKLFLSSPDPGLPATLITHQGAVHFRKDPVSPGVPSNLIYTGSVGKTGSFSFDSPVASRYQISIDINQNGLWGDGNDVVLFGDAVIGRTTRSWDGRDSNGALVSGVEGGYNARVILLQGEMHLPFFDVEHNPYGLQVERLNGSDLPDFTIYFDDAILAEQPGYLDVLRGARGIDSRSGARAFAEGFGNGAGLDTWVYAASSPVYVNTPIFSIESDLRIELSTATNTVQSGESVYVTLQINNDGPDTTTVVQAKLYVPSGLFVRSATASTGRFDPASGVWEIDSVPVGSEHFVALILDAQEEGAFPLFAEVEDLQGKDPDSQPQNLELPLYNRELEDDEARLTIYVDPQPSIGISRRVVKQSGEATGFSAAMEVVVENLGNTPLEDIVVKELLPDAFMGTDYRVSELVVAEPLYANSRFDGKTVVDLLDPSLSRLDIGEKGRITYTVHAVPVASYGPYEITAEAYALGAEGSRVQDISDDGMFADSNGNGFPGDLDENDPTVLLLTQRPSLGLALRVGNVSGRPNFFSATCEFVVENLGDVPLAGVQIEQALANLFGKNRYEIENVTASPPLALNPDYNGDSDSFLLDPTGSKLGIGQHATVRFDLEAFPLNGQEHFVLQALASADTPGKDRITDRSDNGLDTDPNGNGMAADPGESDPTILTLGDMPVIGAALDARTVTGDLDGFTVHYELRLKNLGSVPLYEVKAQSDLASTFPGTSFTVQDISSFFSIEVNPEFDGVSDINLIRGQEVPFLPGQTMVISFIVEVSPESYFGPFENSVYVSARSEDGAFTTDLSDIGRAVDPDGDGDPSSRDENEIHTIRFAPKAALGTALGITNIEGDLKSFTVTYTMVLENMSDVPLSELSMQQKLDTTFFGAHVEVLDISTEGGFSVNRHFDGKSNIELLDQTTGVLDIGASTHIDMTVRVIPGENFGPYFIGFSGHGFTPFGSTVQDQSTNGLDPDPNQNGNPDEESENQPGIIYLDERPVLGISMDAFLVEGDLKEFVSRHVIRVANLGDVPLDDIQVNFDFASMYDGAQAELVQQTVRGTLRSDETYNGIDRIGVVDPEISFLADGDTARIEVDVLVRPVDSFGPYQGQAYGSAHGPNDTHTFDLSDRGVFIDIDGNGVANEESENRPVSLIPKKTASIGVARLLTRLEEEKDGVYEVEFDIHARNLGDVPLSHIRLIEDFKEMYEDAVVELMSVGLPDQSPFSINAQFDGVIHRSLLVEDSTKLLPGELLSLRLGLRISAHSLSEVETRSYISGQDPFGTLVSDWSNSGADPDPNGNGMANEEGEDTSTVLIFDREPALDVSAEVLSVDGDSTHFVLTLGGSIMNTGQREFSSIQMRLDLNNLFPAASFEIQDVHVSSRGVSGAYITPASDFDGRSVTTLFDEAKSHLPIGAGAQVSIVLNVNEGGAGRSSDVEFEVEGEVSDQESLILENVSLPISIQTSSGESAGLESNGDLASLVAERIYRRSVEPVAAKEEVVPMFLKKVGFEGVHGTGTLQSGDVFDLIPVDGPARSEAVVKTPVDLFGVTNATSVLAVDYVKEDQRVAGLFIATSPAGETYEHTKNICDRLKGAALKSVELVSIQGYPFILSALVHPSGDVDYAISFIGMNQGASHLIDSRFIRDQYPVESIQTGEVLNFQAWSYNPAYTIEVVEEILDKMREEGRIDFVSREENIPRIPDSFVQGGDYQGGNLMVKVKGTPEITELRFLGEVKTSETSEKTQVEYVVPVLPGVREHDLIEVELPSGFVYDALLHVTNDANDDVDEIYIADGTWGYVAPGEGSEVKQFEVMPQKEYDRLDDRWVVERGVYFKGEINDKSTVFRHFKPGGQPVDISGFDYISFTVSGSGNVHLQVEGVRGGGGPFVKSFELQSRPRTVAFLFEDLERAESPGEFLGQHVTAFSFVVESTGEDVEMLVEDVFLGQGRPVRNESEGDVPFVYSLSQNYPNPFASNTTLEFGLPEPSHVEIEVYDILGREVMTVTDQDYASGNYAIELNANQLASGMYMYRMVANEAVFTKVMHVLR